jgi:hypothetical protein
MPRHDPALFLVQWRDLGFIGAGSKTLFRGGLPFKERSDLTESGEQK